MARGVISSSRRGGVIQLRISSWDKEPAPAPRTDIIFRTLLFRNRLRFFQQYFHVYLHTKAA